MMRDEPYEARYIPGSENLTPYESGTAHLPDGEAWMTVDGEVSVSEAPRRSRKNPPPPDPEIFDTELIDDEDAPMDEAERFLTAVGHTGSVALAWKPLRGAKMLSAQVPVSEVSAYAERHRDTADVYLGVNSMRDGLGAGSRGRNDDVTRVTALYCDLDFKDGGMGGEDACREVINDLANILGEPPAVVVLSGGGMQPYWPLADGEDVPRAKAALGRFKALVRAVAHAHGGGVDSTFDLARVLRLPGTLNHKYDPPREVTAEYAEEPESLTLERVEDAFDAYGVPMDVGSGETVSDAGEWAFAGDTCGYVKRMIDGWPKDVPKGKNGRHGWVNGQVTRLVAAKRMGCIAEADFEHGLKVVQSVADGWRGKGLHGPKGRPDPDESRRGVPLAVAIVECKTDEQTAAELGGHTHEPPKVTLLEDEGDGLWDTPPMRHIRQAAHSQNVTAPAVLGAVLARVSFLTYYAVELPTLGNRGSINFIAGLMGETGDGKGVSMAVAERLLPVTPVPCGCQSHEDYYEVPQGTGEGLAKSYYEYVAGPKGGKELRRDRFHVLMNVDEIDALTAVASRNGATIGPTLRSLWSGANAGFQNADSHRKTPLRPGTYRFALCAGVQPSAAEWIFADTKGGTPGRFVWFPTVGKDVPDLEAGESLPDWPGPLPPVQLEERVPTSRVAETLTALLEGHDVEAVGVLGEPWTVPQFTVDAEVLREIQVRRNRRSRGVARAESLDKHRDFNRLRVAALLARLHGQWHVDAQMWAMAGKVMNLSDRVRDAMRATLAAEEAKRAAGRGRADAVRNEARDEAVAERVATVARAMWKGVVECQKHRDDPCPPSCAMNAPAGKYQAMKKDALEYALDHDWLQRVTSGKRDDYLEAGGSKPA